MALGSSAPEILLNVVEVAKNKFFAGSLGPGTIVGSAAFNLLVISAVCVASIPNGEVRIIHDASVYAVTAAFFFLRTFG
jgi:Ca2+/Na+ antiporter